MKKFLIIAILFSISFVLKSNDEVNQELQTLLTPFKNLLASTTTKESLIKFIDMLIKNQEEIYTNNKKRIEENREFIKNFDFNKGNQKLLNQYMRDLAQALSSHASSMEFIRNYLILKHLTNKFLPEKEITTK